MMCKDDWVADAYQNPLNADGQAYNDCEMDEFITATELQDLVGNTEDEYGQDIQAGQPWACGDTLNGVDAVDYCHRG